MSDQNKEKSSWFNSWWKILIAIVFLPFTLIYFTWKSKLPKLAKLIIIVLIIASFASASSKNEKENEVSKVNEVKKEEVAVNLTISPEAIQKELTLSEKLDVLAKNKIDKNAKAAIDEKTGLVLAEISTNDYTFLNNTDIANSIWKFFIPFSKEAFNYEGVKEIKVTITTEFIDSYGNSVPGNAVYVDMLKEDFELFNWDKLKFTNPKENKELLDKSNYFVHGVIYKDVKPDKLKISFL